MTEAERLLREARDYLITDEAAARAHGFTIVANNRLDLRRRIAAHLARCEKHTEPSGEGVKEACAGICEQWKNPSFMQLRAGEMNTVERRTCVAVLAGVASAIRALDLSTVGGKEKP